MGQSDWKQAVCVGRLRRMFVNDALPDTFHCESCCGQELNAMVSLQININA